MLSSPRKIFIYHFRHFYTEFLLSPLNIRNLAHFRSIFTEMCVKTFFSRFYCEKFYYTFRNHDSFHSTIGNMLGIGTKNLPTDVVTIARLAKDQQSVRSPISARTYEQM